MSVAYYSRFDKGTSKPLLLLSLIFMIKMIYTYCNAKNHFSRVLPRQSYKGILFPAAQHILTISNFIIARTYRDLS